MQDATGLTVVNKCETGLCEEGMQIGGLYCCSGGGYTGRYFNGTLDELRVWRVARTEAQLGEWRSLPLNAGDFPELLFYFPLDEAGMELGANVVESRALPWYAILGNAKGAGRPHWVVSHAPMSCRPGSRAPICRRIESSSVSLGGNSLNNEEDQTDISPAALLGWILVSALASALCASVLTYVHLTGTCPPALAAAAATIRGLANSAQGYVPAALGETASSSPHASPLPPNAAADADWRWAQPPRVSQPAFSSPMRTLPPAAAPPPATPKSYGGL